MIKNVSVLRLHECRYVGSTLVVAERPHAGRVVGTKVAMWRSLSVKVDSKKWPPLEFRRVTVRLRRHSFCCYLRSSNARMSRKQSDYARWPSKRQWAGTMSLLCSSVSIHYLQSSTHYFYMQFGSARKSRASFRYWTWTHTRRSLL